MASTILYISSRVIKPSLSTSYSLNAPAIKTILAINSAGNSLVKWDVGIQETNKMRLFSCRRVLGGGQSIQMKRKFLDRPTGVYHHVSFKTM